jgi:hypothetical protein
MHSQSLTSLEDGLREVRDLQGAYPQAQLGEITSVTLTRAIGRASVVILSSHLEGYIDSLNTEAVTKVNEAGLDAARIPQQLRLLHSKPAVETLASTSWQTPGRASHLIEFMATEGWLWGSGDSGAMQPDRFLTWMKSPAPRYLVRYFRYWGIEDVFSRITRTSHTRDELFRRLRELVDKRNSIAHGDLATVATPADVRFYLAAIETFATRVDRLMSRELALLGGFPRPW